MCLELPQVPLLRQHACPSCGPAPRAALPHPSCRPRPSVLRGGDQGMSAAVCGGEFILHLTVFLKGGTKGKTLNELLSYPSSGRILKVFHENMWKVKAHRCMLTQR